MKDKTKSKEPVIIDSKLLPLFEKAENGCLTSQVKLASVFCRGEGAKQNEKLARKYDAMLYNNTDNPLLQLGTLFNRAVRSYERKDKEDMILYFGYTFHFMLEYIPMEEWDFSLIQRMYDYTQGDEKLY